MTAIAVGMTLGAQLILIDERKGASIARRTGFEVTGTLGLLTRSAQVGLVDLAEAIARLKRTAKAFLESLADLPIENRLRRLRHDLPIAARLNTAAYDRR